MRTRTVRDERGMTVVELTVGLGLLFVVVTAALGILISTQRTVSFTEQETESMDAVRISMERLVNEIRDAVEIELPSSLCPVSTCITLERPVPSGGTQGIRYTYDAASSTLFREAGDPLSGTWDPPVAVARDIRNGNLAVFCRGAPCTTPSEQAVRIELLVGRPSQNVMLSSYVSPRNL